MVSPRPKVWLSGSVPDLTSRPVGHIHPRIGKAGEEIDSISQRLLKAYSILTLQTVCRVDSEQHIGINKSRKHLNKPVVPAHPRKTKYLIDLNNNRR